MHRSFLQALKWVCLILVLLCRPSSGQILEALHIDPASSVSLDKEQSTKVLKPLVSTSSALAKLSKSTSSGGLSISGEKKETPQERLKRIMSRQLNKQIKKDTAVEMAKKREQERQRLEKLAETSRLSRYRRHSRSRSRSYSRSPPRTFFYLENKIAVLPQPQTKKKMMLHQLNKALIPTTLKI
ncbi:hypothetical protein CsSME_00005678 [Camellia sinensis var. sinensis]